PPRVDGEVLALQVGSGLVCIGQNHQAHAVVADITGIQQEAFAQFALDAEVPALHVTGPVVRGNVADLCLGRIESVRASEVIWEPEVSGAEAGAGRVTDRSANSADHGGRLPIDHRIHYIRSVISQQIFAAEPVELNVTNAIGAANN